jgi:lysophospholipase L1-like esterase
MINTIFIEKEGRKMKKMNVKKMLFMALILMILGMGQGFAQSCGDVNNNGTVDIIDALLVAQEYVGIGTTEINEAIADVNADGTISILDALLIAQFYVDIVDELNCALTPPPTPVPNNDPIFSGGPYTFNGSDRYEDLPDNITSDMEDFTIAGWLSLNSKTDWVRFFDFGGSSDVFMMFTPQSGSTGFPYFCITTTGNDGEQGVNGNSALPVGSWQHIAVTKSGSTLILYINGSEVDRNSSLTLSPVDLGTTVNNYLGRSQWPNDPYLDGFVDEFMIFNAALTEAEISQLSEVAPPVTTPGPTQTPGPNVTKKIMPLGDSITDGVFTPGGYRIKLWSNVQNAGKTIDFVGSLSNGPDSLPDKNHEGHSGWRIDQLDSNINGWMDQYQPDIVLLHIGTNDITQDYDMGNAANRVGSLVDKICARLPGGGKVYVAQVIPISYASGDQVAVSFNNQLASMVQAKKNSGLPVELVDMHSALTTSDLQDQVHPNLTGYNKMADVWFNAINNEL